MSQLCCPMLQSHATVKRSVDLKSGVMTYRTVPASVSNVADVTASGAEQCVSSFIIFFGWLSHAGMRSDVEPRSSYPSTPTELVHQENTSYFSGSFDSGLLMSYSCSKELKSLPVETTLTESLLFNHLLWCSQRLCKRCLDKRTQQLFIVNACRR